MAEESFRPNRRVLAALAAIVLLAFALRAWQLDSAHPLQQDEAISGYDAYSIMLTGRDSWGEFMPVLFKEFGWYNNQAQVYLTVPFIAALGLTELAVRLPWAILGALVPIAAFIAARELLDENAGIIAALLAAASPYLIYSSRLAIASNLAPAFTATAIALSIAAARKPKLLPISAIAFAASFHIYSLCVAIAMLFIPAYAIIMRKEMAGHKRLAVISLAILAIAITPIIYAHLANPLANAYAGRWNAFTPDIGYNQGKPVHEAIAANAGTYVNANFLFGSFERLRPHQYAQNPFLPYYFAPLVALGAAYAAVRKRGDKRWLLAVVWIGATLAIAATFYPAANPRRFLLASPAFEIIAGVGTAALISFAASSKRKLATATVIAVLAIIAVWGVATTVGFTNYIYGQSASDAYRTDWYGGGWKEAVAYANAHPEYDRVVATRRSNSAMHPYAYFLFYSKYPPRDFQEQQHGKNAQRPGFVIVTALGSRTIFCAPPDCDENGSRNPLYIVGKDDYPELKAVANVSETEKYVWLKIAANHSPPTR